MLARTIPIGKLWAPKPEPETVPLEYTGKWIAWTMDDLHIVGVGDTIEEAKAMSKAAGYDRVRLEGVPRRRRIVVIASDGRGSDSIPDPSSREHPESRRSGGHREVGSMNRDKALSLLRGGPEGVSEWNRLREAGWTPPDLSEAKLSGADLTGANLSWAELSGADLSKAILIKALLAAADLSMTSLRGADLREANLWGANLQAAVFSGADFGDAVCLGTDFINVDLSDVKGLSSIRHYGPSEISISTLLRSHGKIPEVFLRRCRVPDALIADLPSRIGAMQPIQFYSCYISYSHQNEDFARTLYSRMLQEKLNVYYATADMRGGRKILDQLKRAIQHQDKLLLVLSQASMSSAWVETEIREALRRQEQEKRNILFPIRIASLESVRRWTCFDADTGRDMALQVREYHIPDFSGWEDPDAFEAAFNNLLMGLQTIDSMGGDRPDV